MISKKIKATFIGNDCRLEVGHHYDIDMLNNLATIHRDGRSDVICPYETICGFLNNWCNIEIQGVNVPKNYKPEPVSKEEEYKMAFGWWDMLSEEWSMDLVFKYCGNKKSLSNEDIIMMWKKETFKEDFDDECIIGA